MFSVVLLLALLPQGAQSSTPQDALAQLNEVSQRYADAKSYHIEAVEERTSSNELTRHWDKTLLTAIVAADGRYRYEGRSGFGSAILVSDSTTDWDYHPYDHVYTQQAASHSDPQTGKALGTQEMQVYGAKLLVTRISHQADRLKSATYLPDETIVVNGTNMECYVVHYFVAPTEHNQLSSEWTLWIDKTHKLLRKSLSTQHEVLSLAGSHLPMLHETTVTYALVELEPQEPDRSFTFIAPADAKLVSEFPDSFDRNSPPVAADLTGKPAPELQLKSSDGKLTPLSSFRGKPVFIEFWATWCGPCVELMPELVKLHADTAEKGLAWLSIDSDKDASAVAAFLSREHSSWPNYHDEGDSFGRAFHRVGIPLGVVIDAEGKITFYKSGYGIADLRAAIAKLGPEFSSVAPAAANAGGANSK
jgi:thiol-disulfide isomerase/thioredoxin